MNSVVIIGTAIIDQVMNLKDDYQNNGCNKVTLCQHHGGSMRNVAEICALLGLDVDFIAKFGNDNYAIDLISHLEKQKIMVYGPAVDKPTPVFIKVNGNQEFMFATTTPDFYLGPDDHIPYAVLKDKPFGITDNRDDQFLDKLLKHAPDTRWIISSFIPPLNQLKAVEGIILNEHEYAGYLQYQRNLDYMNHLFDHGLNWLIVTKGANGCVLMKDRQEQHFTTETKKGSTLGCGDAFTSGILYGLIHGWNDQKTIDLAQRLAALTTEVDGSVNPEIANLDL